VSVGSAGEEAEGGGSSPSGISADGRLVAFYSYAGNLVSGDTVECVNPWGLVHSCLDVFLRDRATGTTVIVSVGPDGQPGNSESWSAGLSADGRFIALCSCASNLVPGDTNGWDDVFVRGPLPLTCTKQPRRPLGRFGQPVP
jgi:hypothetical protein